MRIGFWRGIYYLWWVHRMLRLADLAIKRNNFVICDQMLSDVTRIFQRMDLPRWKGYKS